MISCGGGDGRGLIFFTFVSSMHPKRLYLEVLRDPLQNMGPTDSCTQQFSMGFLGIIWIKTRRLKDENK